MIMSACARNRKTNLMSTAVAIKPPPRRWQTALQLAIRDPVRLCQVLGLSRDLDRAALRAATQFPVLAPLEYIARMRHGDPDDPLLRQILPLGAEIKEAPGYQTDPVGDAQSVIQPGLLQKYTGRVLMVTSRACAVHCRYCFRRHFSANQPPVHADQWQAAVEYLRGKPAIEEVILSGGDPLLASDARLASLVEHLQAIPHVARFRIHTRMPIVIPQRVTESLVEGLRKSRLTTVVVVHANHPAELDIGVVEALARLIDVGIPVFNQSVLLRGINDDADTLVQLSRRLVDARVMPYYLHQLDRVAGAAHFEVSIQRGLDLVRQMRAELPGYAVPRYVREIPGQPGKTVLA